MSDELSLKVKNAIQESIDLKKLVLFQKLYKTLGFLGSDGRESLRYCDLSFIVPSNKTARVQEVHITAGHALIEYVEGRLIQEGFLNFD